MNGDVIAFFLVVGVPLIAAFVVIWFQWVRGAKVVRRDLDPPIARPAPRPEDRITRADIDEFSRRVNGGGGEK